MDFGSKAVAVAVLFSLTILINLPFGYFRKKARRFSLKWFIYIHISIPFIFLARLFLHLDFRYIPLFVLAAVIGQVWGGKVEL
jgi:hypothetical protein